MIRRCASQGSHICNTIRILQTTNGSLIVIGVGSYLNCEKATMRSVPIVVIGLPQIRGLIRSSIFSQRINILGRHTNGRIIALISGTLNGRKGTREDILDPFQIQNGWFVIDFPSLLVKPAQELAPGIAQSVQITIDILRLNDEGTCLQGRVAYIRAYCSGEINFLHLTKQAPFLALELQRQGLVQSIKSMWRHTPGP